MKKDILVTDPDLVKELVASVKKQLPQLDAESIKFYHAGDKIAALTVADQYRMIQEQLEEEGYPIETRKVERVVESKGNRMLDNRLTEAERAYCDLIAKYLAENYNTNSTWSVAAYNVVSGQGPVGAWNPTDEDFVELGKMYDGILKGYKVRYERDLWNEVVQYVGLVSPPHGCNKPTFNRVKEILKYKLTGATKQKKKKKGKK